jgi:hypothetical protein
MQTMQCGSHLHCQGRYGPSSAVAGMSCILGVPLLMVLGRVLPAREILWLFAAAHLSITGGSGSCSSGVSNGTSGSGAHSLHSWSISCGAQHVTRGLWIVLMRGQQQRQQPSMLWLALHHDCGIAQPKHRKL